MIRCLVTFFVFFGSLLSASAQSPVERQLLSDLRTAQKRLSDQRAAQSAAREKLSRQITESQNELLLKRRQADISRRSAADQEAFLRGLKNTEYSSSSVVEGFSDSLRAYGVKLSTRFLPGEASDARLDAVFQKSSDANTDVMARLAALELGLERLNESIGGSIRRAKVQNDEAALVDGEVMSFGPSQWFRSADGDLMGNYYVSRSGQLAELEQSGAAAAKALFSGQEAQAAIDITGGKARALAAIKSGPLALLKKGGAWVYPIVLIALVALFCAIKKLLELRTISDPEDRDISELAGRFIAADGDAVQSDSAGFRHPVSQVLPSVIEALNNGPLALGEEVLYERLIPVQEQLRRWLPFIAVTAAIAPLLGLLGTVSGLIKTFSVIAIEGTGEAQSISGGISEALVTTLFGLAVAIPAFMAHALLSRRAKGIEQSCERLALVFLNEVRKARAKAPAR